MEEIGLGLSSAYSSEVEEAIKKVLAFERSDGHHGQVSRKTDIETAGIEVDDDFGIGADVDFTSLDDPAFDMIDFVNEKFPDEASLVALDSFLSELGEATKRTDDEIHQLLKNKARDTVASEVSLTESKDVMTQLVSKVVEIKEKASTSERMVDEICKDIRKLDRAKTNISVSISAIKKLHMLTTAVDQLDYMVEKRQYKEVAKLLDATNELIDFFTEFEEVKKIENICTYVRETKDMLRFQIFNDFKSVFQLSPEAHGTSKSQWTENPSLGPEHEKQQAGLNHTHASGFEPTFADEFYSIKTQTPESLNGACYVIESLGDGQASKQELLSAICSKWLQGYKQVFSPGSNESRLEHTSRRYDWFLRALTEYEEKYSSIFPDHWSTFYHFLGMFCKLSENHLKAVLETYDPPEAVNVGELMRSFKATLDFERNMIARFKDSDDQAAKQKQVKGSVSFVFEPYLVAYINKEQNTIEEQLKKASVEDKGLVASTLEAEKAPQTKKGLASTEESERPSAVFPSSVSLFLAIKNSINRCTQFTTETAFFDLHKRFKAIFKKYYYQLNRELKTAQTQSKPTDASSAVTNTFSWKLQNTGRRFSSAIETRNPSSESQDQHPVHRIISNVVKICIVLNSADYCAETVSQLEETIKTRIDNSYKQNVSLEAEQDLFYKNVSNCVHLLTYEISIGIDAALKEMSLIDWFKFAEVGDQSPYVSSIGKVLHATIPILDHLLSAVYFRSFCDKFTVHFLNSFYATLKGCKLIGEYGAQQLLLDTQSLKTVFLQVPLAFAKNDKLENSVPGKGIDLRAAHYQTFCVMVNRVLGKCEKILKVISMAPGTAAEVLIENFKILLPEGNLTDLETILKLRGLGSQSAQQSSDPSAYSNMLKLAVESGIQSDKSRLSNIDGVTVATATTVSGNDLPEVATSSSHLQQQSTTPNVSKLELIKNRLKLNEIKVQRFDLLNVMKGFSTEFNPNNGQGSTKANERSKK